MSWSIAFDPLLPWWLLAAGAALAVVLLAFGLRARIRGTALRALAFLALVAALAAPSVVREDRVPLSSVVAVVADRSPSQGMETRGSDTDAAVATLTQRLGEIRGIEVREVDAAETGDGTELFGDLARALSDVPPDRLAGVITVTDGIVHDVPAEAADLGFSAPVHALVTGRPDETDRRVTVESAPRFGLVDSEQSVRLRVDDDGAAPGASVAVTLSVDGEPIGTRSIPTGETVSVPLRIEHGGQNIYEFAAEPLDGELSGVNNSAVVVVEGIRENLRVLLVSGEPHAGERTWRNLLKSDASVDLVHFTILRPPEKQDGTPIDELSLIAFPTRELFDTRIDQFDLIIFDRYQRRGVLPTLYFDNIAQYVRAGGAVLIAAGPDDSGPDSIYRSPLASVLPAMPTDEITEVPFRAEVTPVGARHPVTRDLPGAGEDPPAWSRWFRILDAEVGSGEVVMDGPDDKPLLVLAHEGEGRIAMLLSDQMWLWARGFEGGGPHVPLLRRLSHWLMQEPDLEEEALRLSSRGSDLFVERQTLGETVGPATITRPDGSTESVMLTETEPGLWTALLPAPHVGLYRASEGDLTALVHIGPTNPREYRSLISTEDVLAPLTAATGGTIQRLGSGEDIAVPRLVPQGAGATSHGGDGWIGLRMSDAYEVRGLERVPLFSGFLGLALLALALGATWWREGR